ncbi:hypothetical protein OG780_44220 [Streptomyces sp. NBC_00386]
MDAGHLPPQLPQLRDGRIPISLLLRPLCLPASALQLRGGRGD